MSRYHINAKSQRVEECRAKRRCKHGSFGHEHFATEVSASVHLGYYSKDLAVLARLSEHEAMEVRRSVAHNDAATSGLLHNLAFVFPRGSRDFSERVVRAVAENANTDTRTLELLAADADQSVRVLEAVAKHASTPVVVLELLAINHAHDVRANVAMNPNTPYSILEVLAEDYQPVRDAVRERAKSLPLMDGVFLTGLIESRDDEDTAFYAQLNSGFLSPLETTDNH